MAAKSLHFKNSYIPKASAQQVKNLSIKRDWQKRWRCNCFWFSLWFKAFPSAPWCVLYIPPTGSNGLNKSFYVCVQVFGVTMAVFTCAGYREADVLSVCKRWEVFYYDHLKNSAGKVLGTTNWAKCRITERPQRLDLLQESIFYNPYKCDGLSSAKKDMTTDKQECGNTDSSVCLCHTGFIFQY